MKNPWETIPLDDYESHMKLDLVRQLQTMNRLMADQFYRYPVRIAMVLGVAGGNGLEHVDPERLKTVYGVDLNRDYLAACAARYPHLAETLRLVEADLTAAEPDLPPAELVIANIIADIIIRLFDQLDEHLEQGGTLLTSGIIEDRIEDVLAAAEAHGYGVVERMENKGWACITFKRKADM